MELTTMEKKFMNAMRDNEFNDALQDGSTWTFTAIDNSGLTPKQCTGVMSSLTKKGLIGSEQVSTKRLGDEDTVWFTEEGAKLFIDANGDKCSWGGLRLLRIDDEESKEKVVEVVIYTFTGMKIQNTHKAILNNGVYTVEFNNGVTHTFDSKTMIQTDSKNPKFANKIEIVSC